MVSKDIWMFGHLLSISIITINKVLSRSTNPEINKSHFYFNLVNCGSPYVYVANVDVKSSVRIFTGHTGMYMPSIVGHALYSLAVIGHWSYDMGFKRIYLRGLIQNMLAIIIMLLGSQYWNFLTSTDVSMWQHNMLTAKPHHDIWKSVVFLSVLAYWTCFINCSRSVMK